MKEVYYFLIALADREIDELVRDEGPGLRVMRCLVGGNSVYERTMEELEDCSCQSCDHEVNMRFWLRQRNEAMAKLRTLLAE